MVWILAVLLSHWRRHPMQLATLLIGLISATALWSGVQALNQQARMSYDRAAAMFGTTRTPMLVGRDGATFSQQLFVDLRRAGWPVSPVIDGRVQIGARTLQLLGIEPLTLPVDSTATAPVGRGELQTFLTPPGQTLASSETLADLGLDPGTLPRLDDGETLPPLRLQPQLAPGVLVVDIGVAQRLLHLPGRVSRLVVGRPAQGKPISLDTIVGNQLRLVEPDSETDLERLTDSFHLNLTAFGLLSFLVGLFIVYSAIGLGFEQRRPMLRTLRACGVSARLLNGVLIAELILLSLVAGVIGLICGYVIAAALLPDVAASLRGLYGAQIPGQLLLRPRWWLAGLAISVIGAFAAAATSLLKAARLPILAAAQPQAWRLQQQRWLRRQSLAALAILAAGSGCLAFGESLISGFLVLAALLLGAALILPSLLSVALALGERGTRTALANWFWADSRQQLSGLSLALMALLLALAVNVGVGTMVQSFSQTFAVWLDGRLAADLYINATSDAQATQIKTFLTQQPMVTAILPGGRTEVKIADWPVEVLGFADDAIYRERWPLLEAQARPWDRLKAGNGALISEQFARRFKIGLGDHVTIPAPGGDWIVTVAGVYADYGNPKGQIGVNIDALLQHFPDIARTRLGVRTTPGAAPALIAQLQERFDLDDRHLADQATLKTESNRIFNRTFAVTAALNTFTLGVAGIALLTSLLTLGNTRLPQLAPLWAIGITRRRLAAIELLKTLSMAGITAVIALPLGLLVAWCLIAVVNVKAFGWRLPFQVFPLQLIELLGVALLASFAAALLPILKLMRMQPVQLVKVFADER